MTNSTKIYEDNINKKSYHYYVQKFNASCVKLKEIHTYLKKYIKTIDTTIYSNHWFRLPNQTNVIKEIPHLMLNGCGIIDSICQYYDEFSININDKLYINTDKKILNPNTELVVYEQKINTCNDIILNTGKYTDDNIDFFVNNLSNARCGDYEQWLNVGICLYNINNQYLYIWKKWSKQSDNYEEDICSVKWNTFKFNKDGLKIGSLLKWFKDDNKDIYSKFINDINIKNIIVAKFPKNKLKLGNTTIINKRNQCIELNNDECIINGKEHDDLKKSMYIDVFDNNMVIKCKHINCFCKTYPLDHIQLNKYETNIIINNNYGNNEDDLINFQTIEIFEDTKLNKLIFEGLNGKATSIANIIYYKTSSMYNFGEDDNWYQYNKHKWININNKNYSLRSFINEPIKVLFKKVLEYYEEHEFDIKKIKKIQDIINSLDDTLLKNNIMIELAEIFIIHNNENRDFVSTLDNNKYLIGFDNGVYDLKNFEFREGKINDNISMGVGYNYNPEYSTNKDKLMIFLNDIQPNKEDFEYMMTYL